MASFQVFAFIAVDPVGQSLAGFLSQYSIELIFYIVAFGSLSIAVLNYLINPVLRQRFDLNFEKQEKEEENKK